MLRISLTEIHLRGEEIIHRAVAEHLRDFGVPGLVSFHVPNNPRSARDGARLQAMGLRKGVSDFILLYEGEAYALELKAEKGRLSTAQKDFLSDFTNAGGVTAVAYGLANAIRQLESWNLVRGRVQ